MDPKILDFSIPLTHPTLQLALTGPSEADGERVIRGLNDPSVYMNLQGPPYPHNEEHRKAWYTIISEASKENLEELEQIRKSREKANVEDEWSKKSWLGKRPWTTTIRDVKDVEGPAINGSFVGEIFLARNNYSYILDDEERKKCTEENAAFEPGDPRIQYQIGYWVMPEYQAKGIMPIAVKTILSEVWIPYFNLHTIKGTYFEHNQSSRKLMLKCGFKDAGVVENAITVNPAKIGGEEGRQVNVGLALWER